MSIKKAKPGVVAAVPAPPATAVAPAEDDSLEGPVRPVLDELRAFYEAVLPADMAADSSLATELYLTTHPGNRERLHAILAKSMKHSADLGAPGESPSAVAPPERKAGRR